MGAEAATPARNSFFVAAVAWLLYVIVNKAGTEGGDAGGPQGVPAGGRRCDEREHGVPRSGGPSITAPAEKQSFNFEALPPAQLKLANALVAEGQAHLFEAWDGDVTAPLFAQLATLDANYADGGLPGYVRNARKLLADAKSGVNPLEGKVPVATEGHELDLSDAEAFAEADAAGAAEAARGVAYVLVAGGLGERLGYNGIKLELPTETITGRCFLARYIEHILALGPTSELVLMVSADTRAGTERLLADHGNFGMPAAQLHIVQQEKVASIEDNDARLALKRDKATKAPLAPAALQTKPHGHGDVHSLLHQAGLVAQWQQSGVKWVVFFQDTNALMFRSLPAVLGTSARHGLAMNSVCVPRKAGEAIGAIMTLRDAANGQETMVNVEYNQIDPLLKAQTAGAGGGAGMVGDADLPSTGFSKYPGSINQIVLGTAAYARQLARTGGAVPEFVNPKYVPGSANTQFKKPTRLESMMQDAALTFGEDGESVSFTRISAPGVGQRAIFSPVKNSLKEAAAKSAKGLPPHSAASGEHDVFRANADALRLVGARLAWEEQKLHFGGVSFAAGAHVVLSPSFAPTLAVLKSRFSSPARVSVTRRSTLVVEGAGVTIDSLELDGVLVIDASEADPGVTLAVRFARPVVNKGWELVKLGADEEERARLREEGQGHLDAAQLELQLEQLQMRGYRLQKMETDPKYVVTLKGRGKSSGRFVLDESGLHEE